jgi:hypothetical protein
MTYTGRAVVEQSTHDPKAEGSRRHDTQHTNIQQNDTEHKGPNSATQHKRRTAKQHCYFAECHVLFIDMMNVVMLNVIMLSVFMMNVVCCVF